MSQQAAVRKRASKKAMVGAQMAANFWAAVQDCLIQFHHYPRGEAAERVTDTWRSLGNLALAQDEEAESGSPTFDDMIYHEEPWYIACNLANQEMPLEPNRIAYMQVLKQTIWLSGKSDKR